MYACGLTVYNRGHVGNYRTILTGDVLRRALRFLGYRVNGVLNITDVDDRIIQQALAAKKDLHEFTRPWIEAFDEDMSTLRIERPEHLPRATDHVPEMIDIIERLTARGHTYEADGSVYFRISSFPEYGRLSGLDAAGIKDGAQEITSSSNASRASTTIL